MSSPLHRVIRQQEFCLVSLALQSLAGSPFWGWRGFLVTVTMCDVSFYLYICTVGIKALPWGFVVGGSQCAMRGPLTPNVCVVQSPDSPASLASLPLLWLWGCPQ